jgi:hypothetical protein
MSDDHISDCAFERRMILARLRWNLTNEAGRIIGARAEPISRDGRRDELILAVARAVPRSKIVPWHVSDRVVLEVIQRVATDVVKHRGKTAVRV